MAPRTARDRRSPISIAWLRSDSGNIMDGDMASRSEDPSIWDSQKVDTLGGAFIAGASTAGIGVSLVSMQPPEPRVVYISDKGVEILGYPRETILERPAGQFLSPDEKKVRDLTGERGRSRTDPQLIETVIERADGKLVPLEVSFAPIRLDGQPGIIAFIRDVTARSEGRAALRRSEERFRQLIERAPDGVWINDGARLRYANLGAARMLGYESVEALLAVDPRNIVAPEDQATMRERTLEMLRTGEPLPPREYRSRRKDGSWVMTEVQSMPVEWEGAPAILGLARDVTNRNEMQVRLAQSERLAALGTLLAGIAHEMNNPLAYALLGVERALAVLERVAAPPDEVASLREILESAHHGATRVAAVVSQIRASSRPEIDERGPVDMRRALDAAMRVTKNEIQHRARLVTELADVPPVLGNEHRIEQVFLNLLVNAVQALPDDRPDNEIRVTLRADETGGVVVEVADNGPGIPDDIRARIFDPFFTTKRVGIGLGLGLSICHGIVTAHGGTIAVDSKLGAGSIFRVILPAMANHARSTATPAPRVKETILKTPLVRLRVLVIDDEPALAAMIVRVLEDECDVHVAVSGREGLDRLVQAKMPYDVILCDLMMPDMTGMDLFAEVARRYPGLEDRFVLMTGGAFTPRATAFLARIGNRRLEKPFDGKTLRAAIARRT
jgi:PAS domain S-box-containing protein